MASKTRDVMTLGYIIYEEVLKVGIELKKRRKQGRKIGLRYKRLAIAKKQANYIAKLRHVEAGQGFEM